MLPSYTYSPNTVSPQALERLEGRQDATKASPKKRKSWGQVLPEPKTNLPPRKRAKTEDEKEQRRIERVKRNRLAAHNSRERKRAEVDQLTSEKQCLEAQMKSMQARMNEMHAQLLRYHKMYPQLANSAPSMSPPLKDEMDFEGDSAYSSSSTSTIDPKEASFSSPCPTDMSSPQSNLSDAHAPAMMAESTTLMPDLTQHSAAMLCDLPCQSESSRLSTTPITSPSSTTSSSTTSSSNNTSTRSSPSRTSTPSSWLAPILACQLLCLTTLLTTTTTTYTTPSSTTSSISAGSNRARTPSRTRSPSRRPCTATLRNSSRAWSPSRRSALLRSLARASLSSPMPALARPLATSLAWRRGATDAAFLGGAGHSEDSLTQEKRLQSSRMQREIKLDGDQSLTDEGIYRILEGQSGVDSRLTNGVYGREFIGGIVESAGKIGVTEIDTGPMAVSA